MPINIFLPQVTRIPIEGPAPFNTLVCVAGESTGGPQQVENGKLSRYPVQVGTGFKLAGFDQRVPPVFQHSTAAWLNALGPAHSGAFVYAVDRVTNVGFSAYDGSYSMNLDLALMPADTMWETCFSFFGPYPICFYYWVVQVCSYVLCYEPPLPGQVQAAPGATQWAEQAGFRRARTVVEVAAQKMGIPFTLRKDMSRVETAGDCGCGKHGRR